MAKRVAHSLSDTDLVSAVQNERSDDAFSVLYDRHTPRAFQTAWRILGGNPQLAEDAVQEAWIRAVSRLAAWSGEQPFGAWLRGITLHVAIDLLRHDLHLRFTDDFEVAVPEHDVEHIDLDRAIAALPPGYRAVLVLHDVEGFTHEEIAEQLGITAGTSKGQLFKARRAVRARLTTHVSEKA